MPLLPPSWGKSCGLSSGLPPLIKAERCGREGSGSKLNLVSVVTVLLEDEDEEVGSTEKEEALKLSASFSTLTEMDDESAAALEACCCEEPE